MSKLKSRFRPKAPKPPKPSAPKTWHVDIHESEADWGVRLDERLDFPTEEQALAYAQKFNEEAATYATAQQSFHAFAYCKKPTKE